MIIIISGCGARFHEGNVKTSYNPQSVNGVSIEHNALIKVTDGFTIWQVDKVRLIDNFQVNFLFGKRVDSIIIKEGQHTIYTKLYAADKGYLNINIYFKNFTVKSNHTYLIDYIITGNQVFYWIKDLTENKVVYGTEKTKKDFEKKV